ncbi:sialate O-acetylesterase [Chitinophaga sp. RAB17]|uniref:sialate O-acetylesterase n=1 Tax=Chitinophaga sp. RAB17 TaxID=3233049 RepID=UPI003F8E1BB5
MVHSFLMIGQSNMAGRGFLKDVEPIYDEHIKMLRNGRWQMMSEPINFDRPSSGIGLASSFAAAWRLKNPNKEIGLIPCADGGTSLDDWAVGGALFEHAVLQAKLAQRISNLDGILWHQGENDCSPDRASRYGEKFSIIIEAFRRELSTPDIPLIIGGLGDFLTSGLFGQYFSSYPLINQALQAFAGSTPHCYFVTATDLTANPDGVHFNALSQRLFGVRYFAAYDKLKNVLEPLADENDIVTAINERPLTRTEKIKVLENKFATGEISPEEYQAQVSKIDQQ